MIIRVNSRPLPVGPLPRPLRLLRQCARLAVQGAEAFLIALYIWISAVLYPPYSFGEQLITCGLMLAVGAGMRVRK